MIVVKKADHDEKVMEPVLVYDAEREELWGYDPLWSNCLDKVGMTEPGFASFFDGPNLFAFEVDEDPFDGLPDAEEELRNYPVGSEEIPDLPTPEPAAVYYDRYESEEDRDHRR